MRTARHFHITTLPALGELGSSPSMKLADLIEHVEEIRPWAEPLEALALLDDLLQRESLLAGEREEVEPSVLTIQQVRGEAALGEELEAPADADRAAVLAIDLLWERYFRYAHQVGRSRGSRFLVNWVEFEIALRNALVAARARRLNLNASDYLVASDLMHSDEDPSPVLSAWESAPTPLAALRVVMRARWSWLDRNDRWYSFSVDELLAYAARVMLLEQWLRTEEKEEVTL